MKLLFVCKFLCGRVFNSFGYKPRRTVAGSHGKTMLSFEGNCQTVFPPAMNESPSCSTSLLSFNIFWFLVFILIDVYRYLIVVLIGCSLMTCVSCFLMLICHLYVFFGEVPI